MTIQNKSFKMIVGITAFLLLIPLIAMQFTTEVNWNLMDFVVAGILLFGFGLLIEFALRKIKKFNFRILALVSIVVVFLLIWAELAVGIFGTPFSGS